MGLNVNEMRKVLLKMYPNDTWKYKVMNMSDNQVMAIYYTNKKSGRLQELINANRHKSKEHQVTLNELYLNEKRNE